MKELLYEIGLEPERVHMYNLSAAMAGDFAADAKEITEKIAELGPNPLRVSQTALEAPSKENDL